MVNLAVLVLRTTKRSSTFGGKRVHLLEKILATPMVIRQLSTHKAVVSHFTSLAPFRNDSG